MGDETPQNEMNLDLNLGPVENEPRGLNLEGWLDGPVRDSIGQRALARQRWRSIWRPVLFHMESLETGEGSMAAVDESPPEVTKACDNVNGHLKNDILGEKEDVVKSNGNEGGFFDCNICLDMASEPVVTCCGHLFCWPCLYRWLHIDADVKECPICKGEMTTKTLTPIYGRGNPTRVVNEDTSLKIPDRPKAKRVESWRQTFQRNVLSMPMDEMIRRLGSRFDLTRDLVQGNSNSSVPDNPREILERNTSLVNRYFNSRRLRGDSSLTLVGPFQIHQEQTPSMDDRDSVSSIDAVIQSESQTVDTALEIDSRVSAVSTSSSRRRSESSRADSGDSRAPIRRRFN